MKNSTTLTLASSIFAASLLFSATSIAAQVKTAGQAMTLCKAQAEKAHPEYLRSKSTKIKQSRGVFKIKMKVITPDQSLVTLCEVNKDGTVLYAKV